MVQPYSRDEIAPNLSCDQLATALVHPVLCERCDSQRKYSHNTLLRFFVEFPDCPVHIDQCHSNDDKTFVCVLPPRRDQVGLEDHQVDQDDVLLYPLPGIVHDRGLADHGGVAVCEALAA